MSDKNVLLLGSYGQTNLGDDVLMWSYLDFLYAKGFRNIYVNANTTEHIPKPILEKYPDLHIIETYKTSVFGWWRLMRRMNFVVYGGGTIYKELYASTGRTPYSVITRIMVLNWMAWLCGARLYHLHIGIGSLKTKLGRFITKLGLVSAAYTIFRDQSSYNFAIGTLKLPPKKFSRSTDGLFINHRWQKVWQPAKLDIDRKKYKTVVGLNVLSDIPDWIDRRTYLATIRKFTKQLLNQGSFVLLLPFQNDFNPRNDHIFMQTEILPYLKGHKDYQLVYDATIDNIASYIQQCDVFIGMRFHSLLLATATRTPFVALAYDTKCWRFVQENNYPYAMKLEDLTLESLTVMHELVLSQRHQTTILLRQIAAANYQEAEEGLRNVQF